VIARIRAWLQRRRARRCARGDHVWITARSIARPQIMISRCKHCPASYRTYG
jgi:hypothetical protein